MLKTIYLVYVLIGLYTMFMIPKIYSQKSEIRNIKNIKKESVFECIPCGDDFCDCKGNSAKCCGHQLDLQYIPRLTRNIKELDFCSNYLPDINLETFYNISDLKLECLELDKNQIVSVTSDAFKNLIFLKSLSLGTNPAMNVSELASAFSSLNKKTINGIQLQNMGWNVIYQYLFVHLYDSNLEDINLSANELQTLDFQIFSGFKCLFILDLMSNKLLEIKTTERVEHLQDLYLDYNKLSHVPNFCNNFDLSEISYLPALEFLCLSFNSIKVLSNVSFQCLPSLKYLCLTGNPIQIIHNNFISSLDVLSELDLSQITFGTTVLEQFAFNSTSLTLLEFERCNFQVFKQTDFPVLKLKYSTNLTGLSLMHTELPDDNTLARLHALISPLRHLQKLDLSFTRLKYLPQDVFSKMKSLESLNLSHNLISSWDGERVFGNSNITTLLLNGNHISTINDTSFPPSMLNSLNDESLDLSDNFYLCTCETLESVNWLRRYEHLLVNYPEEYTCFGPDDLKGTLLQNYNPSPDSCSEKNIALFVSVPVSVIAIATMSAIFLVYKCRWRLRYGVYLFMNRHKHYERIDGSDSFVYAGFVIYADDDRNWVHNELIHRIEDQEGFRLCIRLRDFDVGKVHVDNIVDNMFLSEKIIVILSNNFAKDEWCHFQLLLAETRLLKQNTDMLVIFMLEEISSDCLRASLYKLVTDRQYALWSNDGTGNNLFWEQAVSRMKRSTAVN